MSGERIEELRRALKALGVATWMVDSIIDQVGPLTAPPAEEEPVYPISAAAARAGMHPQTLRQYDRLGLVTPSRTKGRGRRYSAGDVRRLREIQRLSLEEGINLAGISRIMDLERRNERLEREVRGLRAALDHLVALRTRVFAADRGGDVTQYARGQRPRGGEPGSLVKPVSASRALIVWGENSTLR